LARAELHEDLGLVTCVITAEDLTSAGIDWGDMDNLIDLVRMAEEADSAAVLKVLEADRVKVSLRSRGGTDVGSLAAALGGGGHRLAAGFTYTGTAEQALAEIKTRIGQHR
jgi:phosphoesterase RecJ-like protein